MNEQYKSILRIRLFSWTYPGRSYMIEVDKIKKTVSCDCRGFRTAGLCKHVKAYKKVIKLFLDAKEIKE